MLSHPLILASRSPRRKELLAAAGYAFSVVLPCDDADQTPLDGETPQDFVQRLAEQKARSVATQTRSGWILGCDTVAVCQSEVLGKPQDRGDARRMLQRMRGDQHVVYSGLCLLDAERGVTSVRFDQTLLAMEDLSDDQIDAYLATGLWRGKAGGFGYQDRLDWINIVRGSESNVVGLPMELLVVMLDERTESDADSG